MSDKSFFDVFLFGVTVGVTVTAIFCTTSHLIEQQRGEIEKLILRLEECEKNNESSQDS